MGGSTAFFIAMPIVVIFCLGVFILLPFLGDRANQRLVRSPSGSAPGGGAVPQQRRGDDDSATGDSAHARRDAAAANRPAQ
jgi:hypothetical protein